jgi:hypothetical protein
MASLNGRLDFRVVADFSFRDWRSPAAAPSTLARGSIRGIIPIAMANQAFDSHAQTFSSRPARLGATDAKSPGLYRLSIACTGQQVMFAAKKA